MRIFLSHASDDKHAAESLAFSLRNRGHSVFLDRDDLPPGETYDKQIELAVRDSDLFIFLISPASVVRGRYTLTELSFARKRWPDPHGRLLPVMVTPTAMDDIPSYLKAVTILEPLGSVTAETAAAVDELGSFSRALAVALKFAAFGVAAGVVASFMPYFLPSIFGFRLFGIAPDIGICIGTGIAAACYWALKIKEAFSLAKIVAAAVMLWFALIFASMVLQVQIRPDASLSEISELSILNNDNLDEETKEKIKLGLQEAETYSNIKNFGWSSFVFMCLGSAFCLSLAFVVGLLLRSRLSTTGIAVTLALGSFSGLLWSAFYTRQFVDLGPIIVIKPEGENFAIWSSIGLMVLLAQWLALTFAAVGFNLGRNYNR